MKYLVFLAVSAVVVNTCAARQCKVKFEMIGNHSACLSPSPLMEPGTDVISQEEREEIVTLHNTLRAKVRPPAANMQRVVWDEEIAAIAQAWASNCVYEHEPNGNRQIPGRFAVGQNLAINYKDWFTTINEWFAEKKDFELGKGSKSPEDTDKPIGHYVQMVYATAARLGCGQAVCGGGIGRLYVCNYAFGVTEPKRPYEEASKTCEACPNSCDQDLCDCGGKVCENGGTLDPDTCECTCLSHLFLEPHNCRLNCSAAADPWYCTNATYAAEECLTSSNLMYMCPEFCRICPWGGMNFKEPTEQPMFTTTRSETASTLTSSVTSSQTTTSPTTQVLSTTEGWWLPTVTIPTTVGAVSAGIRAPASESFVLVLLLATFLWMQC